jgi:hypothetical protein
MMRILATLLIVVTALFIPHVSDAQTSQIARPGSQGVFIFPGSYIPCGTAIISYKIERRSADSIWKPLYELKTPASLNGFLSAVDKAKLLLPSQPLPSQQKLQSIYERAKAAGSVDSLKGTILHYPVKMALGLIFHDSTAKKGSFQYRVSALDKTRKAIETRESDWVSMPYKAVFDEVQLVESSRNEKSVTIKWKSAGNNSSPLFMVHKVEAGKPANAAGITGRYTVNDTTYYTFRDSIKPALADKELQYYMVPFDLLGNAGKPSRVVAITSDDFSKASFRSLTVSKLPDRFGNLINWSFTLNGSLQSFTIYRSEEEGKGFIQLATVPASDSVYTDDRIKPEKNYYYFIQANALHGSRYKQSNKVFASAFSMRKLLPPVISGIKQITPGIEITVDSIDLQATGIRIFRKCGNEIFTAASDFIAVNGSHAVFIDQLTPKGSLNCQYTVRAEKPGYGISDLSGEVSLYKVMISNPSALRAAFDDTGISLLWADVKKTDSLVKGYIVSRRTEEAQADDKQPFIQLSPSTESYISNYFLDRTAAEGSVYTYRIQSAGTEATVVSPGSLVTVALQKNPLPPFGFVSEETKGGNRLSWVPLVYEGIQTYRIYKAEEGKSPQLLITLPSSVNEYLDKRIPGSGPCRYYITSANEAGTESSPKWGNAVK